MAGTVRTTCPYCGVGCGVIAEVGDDGSVAVRGDPDHPANRGRLCSKGAALADTLELGDRLLHPRVHGREVGWDSALNAVAEGFAEVIRRHGPDAVAFYVSGQLLTEDYYVANKLMKGFIGSGNIDTNSRLCMSSAVAGQIRAFGSDTVPCHYDDVEAADLVVIVGSNLAWCHPVLFQRLRAARAGQRRPQVVVVDPRRTRTAESADLHLGLAPGSDAILFNGLLNYLRRDDAIDWEYLEHHTEGFAAAMAAAREGPDGIPAVAAACGLDPDDVGRFFRLFARTRRTVTLFSQGVNQSSSGTDKVNAIINCHLATGRIAQPGCGPFSITGQPNAMGGREVGGLATTLAAHMDFDAVSRERLARFWDSDRIAAGPGLKAVDLFEAIGDGRVKAVWIMATNPAVSLPDAGRVREALARCELVVLSDCVHGTDTAQFADILLPASTWGEKDGTVTNSERCISRQRTFRAPPGDARPDWWIVCEVARRMGHGIAFNYACAADIFREHAELSAFENNGERLFDIGALAQRDYARLAPCYWPAPSSPAAAATRPFESGRYPTPSGRARLVAVTPRAPAHPTSHDYPLALSSGRLRDQWHTMTRTGWSPRLTRHEPEPFVEVAPETARLAGVRHGALARISSRWGAMIARVRVTADQRTHCVFVPMHWSRRFAADAVAGTVINPAVDPVSGEPEFKHTPVRMEPVDTGWHGFLLSRAELPEPPAGLWTLTRCESHFRYEIAGAAQSEDWADIARRLLGSDGEWIEMRDPAGGRYRGARLLDGRVEGCLFVAPGPQLPARDWLGSLFARTALDDSSRASLLAARAPGPVADQGPAVCSCFNVGREALLRAVRDRGAADTAAIGRLLQAGTNCGSCLPEIEQILRDCAEENRPATERRVSGA